MNPIYSIEEILLQDSLFDQYLSSLANTPLAELNTPLAQLNTPLEPPLSWETLPSLLPPSESTSPSLSAISITTPKPMNIPPPDELIHRKPGRKRKPVPTNPEEIHREIELKRYKNTEAARRCRQRKNQRIDELELRVSQLEAENQRLLAIIRSQINA